MAHSQLVDETRVRLNTKPGEELAEIFERHGVIEVTAPPSIRSPWTASYLARKVNGEVTSLLQILGVEKFGMEYNPEDHDLYWLDRNYKNVSLANVGKYDKIKPGRRVGRPRKQGLDSKSGTTAYWREYRERNKEKMKEYQRTYRARRTAAAKAFEELSLEGKVPNVVKGVEEPTGLDQQTEEMKNMYLSDLLKMTKGE